MRYKQTNKKMEAEALLGNNLRRQDKALLVDITIVNHGAGSNLDHAARQAGKHLTYAVENKNNQDRGSFPATYPLFTLAILYAISTLIHRH